MTDPDIRFDELIAALKERKLEKSIDLLFFFGGNG